MTDINSVSLSGRLTADPVSASTQNGTQRCNFTLATNYYAGKDKNGVAFVKCTVWGKLAEIVSSIASKGVAVYISGELRQNDWTDKQGGKHSELTVNVNQFKANVQNYKHTPSKHETNDEPSFNRDIENVPF
jgi:single-strand DNA-binding protein